MIKLSSPTTREYWEIAILHEDEHLLALDKPGGLLVSPDRLDPARLSLMQLLHDAIAAGKPSIANRGLTYLSNTHRLDAEASGVLLFAKSKAVLVALANLLGTDAVDFRHLALVHGSPPEERFTVNAKLAPHPLKPGFMQVDARNGKKTSTRFTALERFRNHTLMHCHALTNRPHQIRVHLQNSGLRVVGDAPYGGKPLLLSELKRDYRLKPGREERPLIARPMVHAEQLNLPHPITGAPITITAPWPKDLRVAVKYLREFGC